MFKKIIAVLAILLCIAGVAQAAYIPSVKTDDGQVKASLGIVHGGFVTFIGATVGDKVEIKNSTDNSGTALITVTAATANQTTVLPDFSSGVLFGNGIYCDVTRAAPTASFVVQILYE